MNPSLTKRLLTHRPPTLPLLLPRHTPPPPHHKPTTRIQLLPTTPIRAATSRTAKRPPRNHISAATAYSAAATALGLLATYFAVVATGPPASFVFPKAHAEARAQAPAGIVDGGGGSDGGVEGACIRLSEVREHGRGAERRWVMRGDRVYDIEDWIPNHPGGEVILRAAGGAIDAYWDIFTIHRKRDVYEILEQYFIGTVDARDLVDGKVPVDRVEDPFESDPGRDASLIVHSEKPFNGETPREALDAFITPTGKHYVRHHLWVPDVKAHDFQLTIELPDGDEKTYSVADLQSKFKQHTITATLQCSGNRRKDMTTNARPASGLQWSSGAISNAEYTGVRLRDVLSDAGFPVDDVPDEVKHVQFLGAEAYGSSIPIEKVVDRYGDVLLVHGMNGQPLTPDHGYPLRVLVPGYVAARSVKWISKIALSEDESTSQWQQRDYKCFGPNQGGKDIDWSQAPAIQETPVQSAIVKIEDKSAHDPLDRKFLRVYGLEEDSVLLEGYAFSGGGRKIVRVDITTDDGRTWKQAELLNQDLQKGRKAWSWTHWRLVVPSREVGKVCAVKAVDEANNTQPETYEPYYNFRGNLTNAWHRVKYEPGSK